nr:hypothetical protein B0A51_08946 [Rachicladosporium sp. CCFEE 5018]
MGEPECFVSFFAVTGIVWDSEGLSALLAKKQPTIYNKGTRTFFDRPSQKRIHLTLTEFIEYCGKGSLPSPLVNQELAIFHWPGNLIPVPYYWGETFANELRNDK